jgi:Protein-glutamine gamma-glutamyltransferase
LETDGKDWFKLKEGAEITPAKAIKSIFNNGKKETYLDCNMMIVALHYKSMLDTYGDDKFDLMFLGGKDLIISQVGKGIRPESKGGNYPTESGKHPFDDKEVMNDVIKKESDSNSNTIGIDIKDPAKELIPGDWVYFRNNEKYTFFIGNANKLSRTQLTDTGDTIGLYGNEWQGEHALYIGNNKFSGFGLNEEYDYNAMINMLYNAFHNALTAYYNHPYYNKYFIDDGGERDEMLAKTQTDWEPAKINRISRIKSDNIDKLGK